MDIDLGFHQIAKFNYYPGWHQQVSVSELLMNKAAWEALSDQHQAMIEIAAGGNDPSHLCRDRSAQPRRHEHHA